MWEYPNYRRMRDSEKTNAENGDFVLPHCLSYASTPTTRPSAAPISVIGNNARNGFARPTAVWDSTSEPVGHRLRGIVDILNGINGSSTCDLARINGSGLGVCYNLDDH